MLSLSDNSQAEVIVMRETSCCLFLTIVRLRLLNKKQSATRGAQFEWRFAVSLLLYAH